MKVEIIFLAITSFFMTNIYTDGKLYAKALTYKKYYHMILVLGVAIFLYWLVKKNPNKARNFLKTSQNYVKYIPMDNDTSKIVLPMLQFTKTMDETFGESFTDNTVTSPSISPIYEKKTKRAVSESRKKYVASLQQWQCGECHQLLTASFEIDHIVRLDRGGSNEITNLIALCRECHGNKTILENM
jgi:cytochrome c553